MDKVTYCPRCDVNVTGSNFLVGATVNIKLDGVTQVTTTVNGTGNIAASFKAPSSPGTYNVVTDGVNEQGQALEGTGNTVTLTVAEETPAPAGGGSGSAAPGTSSPQTGSAPSRRTTSGAQRPGHAGDNNRAASGGEQLGRAPAKGGASAPADAPADASVNTTEGTITADGKTAFAGSVTQATRAEVAERAAKGGSPGSAASPSERSAGADLWSGLTSGRNPSLVPEDGAGLGAPDTGPGLTWGVGLLAAGLLALMGLGVAEAMRRRRAPTS